MGVPAGWSARRRAQVRAAAVRVGIHTVSFLPAPLAVCWHLLAGGADLPIGVRVVVCEAGDEVAASVVGRADDGSFTLLSTVDAATVAADIPATADPAAAAEEVVRRAMAGAELPSGAADLVCTAGVGAGRLALGRSLASVTGVQPMMVAEAELAVLLGTIQAPDPDRDGAGPPPLSGSWRDVAAIVVPAAWSVLLVAQFLAGSQRFGPREKLAAPGMLLASWGGLAFASLFALLAVAAGMLLATTVRHDRSGDGADDAPAAWVRHRLTGIALAGAAAGGVFVAALYAVIGGGLFDLDLWPLLRWSVLPILPAAAALVAVAAAIWRRPQPPDGSWLAWLRFPPVAVTLAGVGALLIALDETGSPELLQPLTWLLNQWLPNVRETIIGPVGRLGGLCLGAAAAWLLVTRPWHRLLLGVPLAVLIASTLAWRTSGAVAVGICLLAAAWWAARAVRVLLRPGLLTPPPGWTTTSPAPGAAEADGRHP
ncbi:hypothetical protein [Dactylosporangium sp. NPDC049140]|uniref:hypothetical protein n=1 Tax=Dactylosporangium sp. NPDC049140 TaxID=3155647 RepID=UPI0033EA8196